MNIDSITMARNTIVFWEQTLSPECILLMGLPWCGKSYVSSYLHKKYGFTILSGENITYAIFGKTHCTQEEYREAYSILHRLIPEVLSAWYRVVIDATNLQYAHRKQIYDVIDSWVRVSGIFLTIDDVTAQKRIQSRWCHVGDPTRIQSQCNDITFQEFKENIDLPTLNESFVVVYSDQKIYSSIDAMFTSFS